MNSALEHALPVWSRSLFDVAIWHSPDAVIATTAQLDLPGPQILYANPAFCRMTGYSEEELLGQTPRILQGPNTGPRVLQELRESLSGQEPFIGSTINYRKDGTPYQVEWTISHVKDDEGATEFFVSIQRVVNSDSARLLHMEAILQAAPVGILLTGPGGMIETANRVAEQAFGYPPGELRGQSIEMLVLEELRAKHINHRKDFARSPETRQMMPERELQGQRQDGSLFPLEVGLAPVVIDGVTYTLASVSDISERKRTERSMAFHVRLQASLTDLGRARLQGASLDELYRQTGEVALDVFGFEAALVVELHSSGQQGKVVAGITGNSMPDVCWPDDLSLSNDNLARHAIESAEPTIGELPAMLGGLMRDWPQPIQALCIPVNEPDRCWGLIYGFKSTHREDDQVMLGEASFQGLSSLADTLASATRQERDQREKQQADHLRLIAGRAANLGGWSYDPQSQEVYWSDEVCAIHELPSGYRSTMEEWLAFYLPDYRGRFASVVEACARSGVPFEEEVEILTAKGNRRRVRVIGAAIRDMHNTVCEVQGAFQDITEQRHVEKRLAQSQEQFRQLADAMPGIVWTADSEGNLDYANHRFQSITGIPNDDLPEGGWIQALHPDDVARCEKAWSKSVSKKQPYEIDFRLYNKSEDQYRWYRVNAMPVRDEQGQFYKWYGSALDIHDRKVLEEELTQVADTLTQTLESITDGFFTLDKKWNFTYCNVEAENLLRKPRTSILNRNIWEVFPEAVGSLLDEKYSQAMATRNSLSFEHYYTSMNTWFEHHVYPKEEGITVYFRDVTEQKISADKIEFLAYHDPLTHLPNRRLFQERLERIILTIGSSQSYAGVILIDVDHFKVLNDTLGHNRGDQLLKAIARRLEQDGFQAARLGGDEFAILLEHLPASLEEATLQLQLVADNVFALLGEPYEAGNQRMQRTCSIGLTLVEPEGDSMEEVMKRVDLALYDVKHRGRNAVSLFNPTLQVEANARAWLETNILAGIKANQFIPYYQPKIDSEGRCVGAEALVRWLHPERGLISPGDFIPVTEETGLISILGQSVLRQVCEQIARWAELDALDEMVVSVNVSARQFHESDLVNEVTTIIQETGIDPSRLQLEVTETLLLGDLQKTVEKMRSLRSLGVSFALDDFGTGYSSLAYLKQLPLDVLKIDQSFVQDLPDDPNDVAIVQTIIALARSLDLDVLAEGVETAEVQNFLIQEGCHTFQGYLYSRPVPVEDFERYLQSLDDPGNLKPG